VFAGSLLARDELTGRVVSGIAVAAYGAGTFLSWRGWDREIRVISRGEDYRGFVRCPGLRDPAQARPEDV
jgi:hypothetical protein